MKYVGEELELFEHARNWKTYFARMIKPFVKGRVLDVGCGMGVNSTYLYGPEVASYTFLEPDPRLLERIPDKVGAPALSNAERKVGTTEDMKGRRFDTILYLDVIEHIENSREELQRAFDLLGPGGHLIILVPAYNYLFSEFDRAIGHFRRYNKRSLRREIPPGAEHRFLKYLDSVGLMASLGNKWFLKQAIPDEAQIRLWDRSMIPASTILDRLLFHSMGRSLLGVFQKPDLNDDKASPP